MRANVRSCLVFVVLLASLGVACGNTATPTKQADGATTTASSLAPPTSTPPPAAGATSPMLADDVIKQAVTTKQEILVVRVLEVQGAAPGSRSETTTYSLEVVRSVLGSPPAPLKLSHYGAPKLEKGKAYVVTTREGNPMWGTKGLRESVAIPAGQEESAADAHAAKVRALP